MSLGNIKIAWVDFDGTLLDSHECWTEAYGLMCESRSVQPEPDVIGMFDEIPFESWQKLVCKRFGSCSEELLKFAQLSYSRRAPNKSVLSVIQSLPRDCIVTVITKEPKELAEFWLSCHDLTLFAGVVTVGDERRNPDYYAVENLLLIDDNYKHCQAAKAAGAFVVGVNSYHIDEQAKIMRSLCDIYIEA